MRCVTCEKTDEEISLEKCPVCFKYFCEEHQYNISGRHFCSKNCGQYFFFGDEDDNEA